MARRDLLVEGGTGFYSSAFCVTREGVLAVDPIDDRAASAYRAAIALVTDAPVVQIVCVSATCHLRRGDAVPCGQVYWHERAVPGDGLLHSWSGGPRISFPYRALAASRTAMSGGDDSGRVADSAGRPTSAAKSSNCDGEVTCNMRQGPLVIR